MSVVKINAVTSLAQKMRQRGGVRIGDALARAEEAMREQREQCLAEIDRALEQLADPDLAPARLYTAASDIVSMCVGEGDRAVAIAARSLCDLLDVEREERPADHRAIALHVAAIRALHRTDADEALQSEVLSGLGRLATPRSQQD